MNEEHLSIKELFDNMNIIINDFNDVIDKLDNTDADSRNKRRPTHRTKEGEK